MVTPPRGPRVVMVVDDDEDMRALLVEAIQDAGDVGPVRVVSAADGAIALRMLGVERPDLLLLDLRMPNVSGAQALKELRANPALAGVPIVAFTAHALDDERVRALEAGFDAVLPKPCLPDALVAFIARTLRDAAGSSFAGG